MHARGNYAAVLHKEREIYVAECPEVGTVSQSKSIEDAVANLRQANELYLEEFPPSETGRPVKGLAIRLKSCPSQNRWRPVFRQPEHG